MTNEVYEEYKKYKEELDKLNLKTVNDLENLVKPLIKDATKIILKKQSEIPENSHLKSHFGGQPYFEKGEEWPKDRGGYEWNLEFIFQIYNDGNIALPENIKLIQFYCDVGDSLPFSTKDTEWVVKIYESLNPENAVIIEKPGELNTVQYCEIEFESIKSLPDFQELHLHDENIYKLSSILDKENPAENYNAIREKLFTETESVSQLGGYPFWIQGVKNPKEEDFQLLFQIDSDEDAGLCWGDAGSIYVFYNNKNKKIEYLLQCF